MKKPEKPKKPKKPAKGSRRPVARPGFPKGVILDVLKRLDSNHAKGGTVDWLESWDEFALIAFVRDDVLYWALRHQIGVDPTGQDVVGAGHLRFVRTPDPVLQEMRAGLMRDYQQKGWYPKILRSLRDHYHRPIESDVSLSLHNERMWQKQGTKVGNRYRLNPRTKLSRAAQARRLCWLHTERRAPPKTLC